MDYFINTPQNAVQDLISLDLPLESCGFEKSLDKQHEFVRMETVYKSLSTLDVSQSCSLALV